jgi:hypothetical protein
MTKRKLRKEELLDKKLSDMTGREILQMVALSVKMTRETLARLESMEWDEMIEDPEFKEFTESLKNK